MDSFDGGPMTNEFSVFISSRMQELAVERQTVGQFLSTLSNEFVTLRPWIFEDDAPASNASIRQVYLDALKRSTLYIGLFWNGYGEWTIDEFRQATDWGIDRHIYVKNVEADRRDPRLTAFLNEQSNVITGITPKWFESLDDLADQIKKSIDVWIKDRLLRRPGDMSATLVEFSDDLPAMPRQLIGRAALLDALRESLEQGDRVLLQGFGGMGKSALAATAAAAWLDDDKGSVLWLHTGDENTDTVLEALVRPFDAQLQVATLSGSAKLKAVRDVLTGSEATLLVLDDVWDGAALSQVLKGVPRKMPVIVTSRQRYALDHIIEVGKLGENEALALLAHYAHQDYARDDSARELVHQLGYHAFALEIAGKTLQVDRINPHELLDRIKTAPHELAMPEDFAEEGRTSIVELMNASLYVLDERVRQIFLAYGGLFVPAATPELLARCLSEDVDTVREGVSVLQRRGLADFVRAASRASNPSGGNYRIHDLAFSYTKTIFTRHGPGYGPSIAACLAYAQAHADDLTALDAEQDNLLGAAQMAQEIGDERALVALMQVLAGTYLSARGHTLFFLGLLNAAIAAAEHLGPEHDTVQQYLLGKRGNVFYDRGDLPNALLSYQTALDIAQRLALPDRSVILLCTVGKVLSDQHADQEALGCFAQAHRLATDLDDAFLLGFVLEHQGYHAQSRGDYDAARVIFAEEVVLAERLDDSETLFFSLLNLGSAEHELGHFTAALPYHQRALEIAREQNNQVWSAHALYSLGEDHHRLEHRDLAESCLQEARQGFKDSGLQTKVVEVETYMRTAGYPVNTP